MKIYSLLFAIVLTCTAVGATQTPKLGSKDWRAAVKATLVEDNLFQSAREKRDKKNYTGAIKDYTKIIKLKPKSLIAYKYRGEVKVLLKDYKGAIEDYDKSIEIDAEDRYAYFDRGNAKAALGDTAGACTDWKKAVELGMTEASDVMKEHCK